MWPVKHFIISALLLSIITGTAFAQEQQQNQLARDTDMRVPGAPSSELISDPQTASIKRSLRYADGSLGPYNCSNGPDGIVCFLVFTRKDHGSWNYNAESMGENARIIDNFHLPHKVSRSYLLDGLGGAQKILDLNQGDMVWWVLVFEVGPKPIHGARIVIPGAEEFQISVH